MPAQRPRAAFEPLSPDLDVKALVESTPNFEYVTRIHCNTIDANGLDDFEKLVALLVVRLGKPLVVEGFDKRLDNTLFSEKWLRGHYSAKTEYARNLSTKTDLPLTIGHYLKNMPLLTEQWTAYNYKDPDRQRIYLKDIDCPPEWHDELKKVIPSPVFYLNKAHSTAPIARAGDLMSCLPPNARAENLMCYIGHEGTYTPAHQEMCGSLGHNIMVEASDGSNEYGKDTKPGSSIWFMTESKDRRAVSDYWMSTLGHDIDIEDHFAQINAWKAAPFTTYVVEQKPGDFILIPPLAAHQVWNRGTRTMKVAWNRTTVETLDKALHEALPHARMVCRDEQYKNKSIVFYSLEHYSTVLKKAQKPDINGLNFKKLVKEFEQLFGLYNEVLLSECFDNNSPERDVEFIPYDSNITCSYCRGNIFNRFLTCPNCVVPSVSDEDDAYDICMECYAMGRSCVCISALRWAEQFDWKDLEGKHEAWRQQLIKAKTDLEQVYLPLTTQREHLSKRTLAEVCQLELSRRPWVDISKPVIQSKPMEVKDSDTEDIISTHKRRKLFRGDQTEKAGRCHICKYLEPLWKLASCTQCSKHYCYGSLYRAFNMLPHQTMEVLDWKCPKCIKICSCAACRRDPTMRPFEPTCMLLGHDTRKIADPRSVESLVDFRHSNLRWLKKAADDETCRSKEHHHQHQENKDGNHGQLAPEQSIQLEESTAVLQALTEFEGIPVDPALERLLLPGGAMPTGPGDQ
ncbi:putative JmjC domain protein [Aspergillus saccharolyticus JOP 1030-1]|uniref:JmjC domain protein n=1 Tax=Aspergillus saccharolyticus JOP 1030-1 TaxID=1450539 RepID=A0A318Z3B6_9EURO|nr:JmjC domain protein [Aspergillus saccharolyticus JOP 1030-1]PYH41801.1 JmjC domain protein [Aspergillus saccharolyticus JOP 1030-1]